MNGFALLFLLAFALMQRSVLSRMEHVLQLQQQVILVLTVSWVGLLLPKIYFLTKRSAVKAFIRASFQHG